MDSVFFANSDNLPNSDSKWTPKPDAPPAVDWAQLGSVFAASEHANVLTGGVMGDYYARQQAVEDQNRSIKDATGQQLQNPFNDGYRAEARAALEDEGTPKWLQSDPEIFQRGLKIYAQQRDDLAQKFPGVSPSSDVVQQGADLQNRAVAAATEASGRGGWLGGPTAGLLGGLYAMRRDPLQVLSLFLPVGPEMKVGWSVAAQLSRSFVEQGALNAGVQAGEELFRQRQLAERGLPHGLGEAMESIGEAGLFGGAVGAGLHGLSLGAHALLAKAFDRAAQGGAPAALDGAHGVQMYSDGVRRMEGEPILPEPPSPLAEGATGRAAEQAIGAASPADAWTAADTLRGDPDLVASALASDDRDIHGAGQLAALDPAAFDIARASLDPAFARHVAALAPPEEQAAIMQQLARAAPRTEDEAHAIVTQELDTRYAPEAIGRLAGLDGAPPLPEPIAEPATVMRSIGEDAAAEGAAPREVPVSPAERDGLPANDLLSKFPVEENGRMVLRTRAEMGEAAARKNWLAQLIENCVL